MSFPCQSSREASCPALPCMATSAKPDPIFLCPSGPTEQGHREEQSWGTNTRLTRLMPLSWWSKAFLQGDFLSCSRKHLLVENTSHFIVISLELVKSWEENLNPENNCIDEYLTRERSLLRNQAFLQYCCACLQRHENWCVKVPEDT